MPMMLTVVSTSDASYACRPPFPASPIGADVCVLEFVFCESSDVAGESGMSIDGIDVGTSTVIGARVKGTVDVVRGAFSTRAGVGGVNGGAGVIQWIDGGFIGLSLGIVPVAVA